MKMYFEIDENRYKGKSELIESIKFAFEMALNEALKVADKIFPEEQKND